VEEGPQPILPEDVHNRLKYIQLFVERGFRGNPGRRRESYSRSNSLSSIYHPNWITVSNNALLTRSTRLEMEITNLMIAVAHPKDVVNMNLSQFLGPLR
jgi:hypothetical protein